MHWLFLNRACNGQEYIFSELMYKELSLFFKVKGCSRGQSRQKLDKIGACSFEIQGSAEQRRQRVHCKLYASNLQHIFSSIHRKTLVSTIYLLFALCIMLLQLIILIYQTGESKIPLAIDQCCAIPFRIVKQYIFNKDVSAVIETQH